MYCNKKRFYNQFQGIVLSLLVFGSAFFPEGPARASGAQTPPADDKPTSHSPAETDKKSALVSNTPFPRKIHAPKIQGVRISGNKDFDYSHHRLTVIVVLASWSFRSSEVTNILNKYYKILSDRGISIQGIFTQDTAEAVGIWSKKTSPKFDLTLVTSSLVDELKNPKIPTFYVVNKSSEFIYLQEMPTDPELLAFVDKLLLWTDF